MLLLLSVLYPIPTAKLPKRPDWIRPRKQTIEGKRSTESIEKTSCSNAESIYSIKESKSISDLGSGDDSSFPFLLRLVWTRNESSPSLATLLWLGYSTKSSLLESKERTSIGFTSSPNPWEGRSTSHPAEPPGSLVANNFKSNSFLVVSLRNTTSLLPWRSSLSLDFLAGYTIGVNILWFISIRLGEHPSLYPFPVLRSSSHSSPSKKTNFFESSVFPPYGVQWLDRTHVLSKSGEKGNKKLRCQ